MKQIKISTIFFLLLGGGAIIILLLIRPPEEEVVSIQEAPSREFEIGGRFSEVCPPMWALAAAREYKYSPSQAFPQELLDSLVLLETYDGIQVMKLETRGFCVFKIHGLVFVLFNDYEDASGVRISGRQDLQNYLGNVGISMDICEIIWSQCHDEPDEAPEEPEDEEIDDEAFVLPQLHERLPFF